MDLKILAETPPFDWPPETGKTLLAALRNPKASAGDRLIAVECAGEIVVVNDELCDALVRIIDSPDEQEELRARAAISLGPVLDQTDTDGFDEDDTYSAPSISEKTFKRIKTALEKLYRNDSIPKLVRRRILEASVRSPLTWHSEAIKDAFAAGDQDWRLTAVFAMRYIPGFDDQILEALSTSDPDIHYEAVLAAGEREIEAAWDHVLALVEDPETPKPLLLAAIEAVGCLRPKEAEEHLAHFLESGDEEIVEVATEAIGMGEPDFDDDEESGDWLQ